MKKVFISLLAAGTLFLTVQLAGCDKQDDNFTSDAVTDYVNLQVGKYVLYQYDSLRFIDFGRKDTIVRYHAKDSVEATVTDNLGRPGFRVIRYLRDEAGLLPWKPILTYQVTPTRSQIETNEAGFRYVKLALPIRDGRSWRGNGFLPDDPYSYIEFSNDEDIHDWDYTYHEVGAPSTYNNKTYDSTITVVQIADSNHLPLTFDIPASKTYWVEKYAKNIGLVYREVEIWEYQPPTPSRIGYRQGFGVRMTIIDHN